MPLSCMVTCADTPKNMPGLSERSASSTWPSQLAYRVIGTPMPCWLLLFRLSASRDSLALMAWGMHLTRLHSGCTNTQYNVDVLGLRNASAAMQKTCGGRASACASILLAGAVSMAWSQTCGSEANLATSQEQAARRSCGQKMPKACTCQASPRSREAKPAQEKFEAHMSLPGVHLERVHCQENARDPCVDDLLLEPRLATEGLRTLFQPCLQRFHAIRSWPLRSAAAPLS